MVFFFFKQKTAYELRISDWSSDVCSSDLEEALKESEQRFRDFAQSGPGGFWEMDESLRFSSFLEVQKGPGRSRPTAAEATGRTLWELFGANPAFDVFWRALRDDLQARRPVRDLRLVYHSPAGSDKRRGGHECGRTG